jgi:zinc transport system ATP-binding protein
MSLLTATNAAVQLGGRTVLHGIDFAVDPGEIVTIVGPNGSGKTTFLRLLVGALQAASGTVARKPGLAIGYVPQRLAVDGTMPMTVERFLNLPVRRDRTAITETLALTGLEGMEHRQLTALSGGQFQRALLARALLGRPDLLVLDEPTQGLDQQGEAAFYSLLETVRQDMGCAVLLVSHDLHVVMRASDRVICVQGAPTVVSEAPEYRALFGLGSQGALALYRHDHDHAHDHAHDHNHDHDHSHLETSADV